jgi:hypothetical protein
MAYPVSPAVDQSVTSRVTQFNVGGHGIIPDFLKQQVQIALGVIGFGSDNFSVRNVSCLFHDDKHPSASLNREKGLYCHVCARWYTWKELAGELGIPWPFPFRTDPEAVQDGKYSVNLVYGLPSETRNGLISVGLSDIARALDLYYHYIDLTRDNIEKVTLDGFTSILQEITNTYSIPFDFKPWTYRKVFEQLQGKRLPKKGELLRTFFLSFFLQQSESKKNLKKSGRGRPSSDFFLWLPNDKNNLAPMAAVLSREWYVDAGSLTIDDYITASHYRAAAMFQEVKQRPGKYARRQLTKSVKISFPTIKRYAELAGIKRTITPPNISELTPIQIDALPENHKALKLAILQRQIKSNVFLMDSRGMRYEYTRAGAVRAAAKGAGKLYRAEWMASDYRPHEVADDHCS